MALIQRFADEPVRLKLASDHTRKLKQGYPWIYQDWLTALPQAVAGTRALVRDKDGSLLAYGMYDPKSPLAVRVCAVERERLDDELITTRLNNALLLRRRLFDSSTSGFRLLNGEGDGLPGLVCDVYHKHAVLRLDGDGPTGFWELSGIADWLQKNVGVEVVFHKLRSDAPTRGEAVLGSLTNSAVHFKENGLQFEADIVEGQKTGFFLDQRDNRNRIRQLAKGRRMLNLCGYTGGFSIYAGAGGAEHVTTVDIAKPALAAAERNWKLNNFSAGKHETVAADVFDFLQEAQSAKKMWDLIVVDPPSFAPAAKHVTKAVESYEAMFTAALGTLSAEGVIAFSSCSSHISTSMFMEICQNSLSKARRRATVLGVYGQPEDHPFPLVCTELQYLKFISLQVR